MQINISGDAELRLKELANAAGFGNDVQGYMLHCTLGAAVPSEAASSNAMLPRGKWKSEFDALLASFPNRDTQLDDSRESIYRGRGE